MTYTFKYPSAKEFVMRFFTKELESWQSEVLDLYDDFAVHGKSVRVAIYAGHGVGKTSLTAWLLIHSLLRFRSQIAGTATANTGQQLGGKLVREVSYWVNKARLSSVITITAHKMFIAGTTGQHQFITWSKERPEAFAGLHAQHVLIAYDEASAIPDDIWVVSEGACTGQSYFWLATGNPTRPSGYFYNIYHSSLGNDWHKIQVSSADLKTKKLANPGYANGIAEKFGIESDIYRVRVLGEFPRIGHTSSLFTKVELDNVVKGGVVPEYSKECLTIGVDVARYGNCASVIAKRLVDKVTFTIFNKIPLTDLSLAIVEIVRSEIDKHERVVINVDGTGVGGGVVDILMRELRNVVPKVKKETQSQYRRITLNEVQFSGNSDYIGGISLKNNRIVCYYKLKLFLQRNKLYIPPQYVSELVGLMAQIETKYSASDELVLQDKNLLGGGEILDVLDALAVSFYDDTRYNKV